MNEFLRKIRDRNVARVGLAYLIGSWAVLQVLDMAANFVGYPEWLVPTVALVLALIFPLVLATSWIYEITPDGIVRESDLGDKPKDHGVSQRFNIVISLLLVLAISVAALNYLDTEDREASGLPPVEKSIAVLPFTAFASGEDDQHFADGLSDTVLHRLAQVNDLKVISRTSSFQYRGDGIDVREVGVQLGVATVLEGSVQRSGDQLRIIAQLVRTDDGSHIWSQTFDRSADDLFRIQDEISNAVVQSLQADVSKEEESLLGRSGTQSLEAYNLVTLAQERHNSILVFGSTELEYTEAVQRLMGFIDEAIEIDPAFAEAYRVKAGFYNTLAFRTSSDRLTNFYVEQGKYAVLQAMALEPDNPRNDIVYGQMLRRAGDFDAAIAFFRRGLAELPNEDEGLSGLSLALGDTLIDPREQLSLVEQFIERNGTSSFVIRQKAFALQNLGRIDEIIDLYETQIPIRTEKQILIADLVDYLSTVQGKHTRAAEVLSFHLERERTTNALRGARSLLFLNVGLGEEYLSSLDEAFGGDGGRWYYLDGDVEALLRLDVNTPQAEQRSNYRVLACLLQRDFECAVQSTIEHEPRMIPGPTQDLRIRNIDNFWMAMDLVVAYHGAGSYEELQKLLRELEAFVERAPESGHFKRAFNLPILAALGGDVDGAIELMRERIMLPEGAFTPAGRPFDAPHFDLLREHVAFGRLIEEYESRRRSAAAEVQRLLSP